MKVAQHATVECSRIILTLCVTVDFVGVLKDEDVLKRYYHRPLSENILHVYSPTSGI